MQHEHHHAAQSDGLFFLRATWAQTCPFSYTEEKKRKEKDKAQQPSMESRTTAKEIAKQTEDFYAIEKETSRHCNA